MIQLIFYPSKLNSTCLSRYLETGLSSILGLPSPNGVLSFFGIASLLGSLAGIIVASMAEENSGPVLYNKALYLLYPARVPLEVRLYRTKGKTSS